MALVISRKGLSSPSMIISSYAATVRGNSDCTSMTGGGGGGGGGGAEADGVSTTPTLVTVLVLCRLECLVPQSVSTSSKRDAMASSLTIRCQLNTSFHNDTHRLIKVASECSP